MNNNISYIRTALLLSVLIFQTQLFAQMLADDRWLSLTETYIDEMPALSPVGATGMGDHRFDGQLDDVSAASRVTRSEFIRRYQTAMAGINRDELSRANQVDYALLTHALQSDIWTLETLRPWASNPLVYTGLAGSAIYSLMAREFAPLPQRLSHVADRLEQLPGLLAQSRENLIPGLVPKIHAETAIKQNRGVISILDNMVMPQIEVLDESEQARLLAAIETAGEAIEKHQVWLETSLLPAANANFRAGA